MPGIPPIDNLYPLNAIGMAPPKVPLSGITICVTILKLPFTSWDLAPIAIGVVLGISWITPPARRDPEGGCCSRKARPALAGLLYFISARLRKQAFDAAGNEKSQAKFAWLFLVGMTGFEPATTCTPCKYATRLRHIPESALRADYKFQIPKSKFQLLLSSIWRQSGFGLQI